MIANNIKMINMIIKMPKEITNDILQSNIGSREKQNNIKLIVLHSLKFVQAGSTRSRGSAMNDGRMRNNMSNGNVKL